ncbi:hypothetical protein DERF_000547 [Dermatophagoides farinae]|uniref:Uncharacterized protein n=1 Tax=Dermatophagoides farinae TaxID=6954 RepID=A0A922I8T1_DERFA|nr:hypothetical protein DERF_000547 [Dermatophagoides farinae]
MFLLVIDCGYLDYRQSYHQILLLLLFISSFFSFKFCINSFTCSPSSDAIRYFSKHFVSSIVCIVLSRLLNNCNTLRLSTIGTPLAIQSPEPLVVESSDEFNMNRSPGGGGGGGGFLFPYYILCKNTNT